MNKFFVVPRDGIIASIADRVKNWTGLLLSRLDAAMLNIGSLRGHLPKLVRVLALAFMAVWFAIAFASVLVVYLAWENMGGTSLLIMMLAFVAAAIGLLYYARAMMHQRKFSMSLAVTELQSCREAVVICLS